MQEYEIGLYGLGVMGSSLAKNMIQHGFDVALYSKPEAERAAFRVEAPLGRYEVFPTEEAFVHSLSQPRVIFLMVTAGKAVDAVIGQLLPYLEPEDVIIDGGNSHFEDTARRGAALAEQGIQYLGVGVSGGELGALYGPSMMVGGNYEGWIRCREILQSIAAQVDGEPCCEYVGQAGAGHYVKMVHTGIEYAILQLLADTYHILSQGMGLPQEEIAAIFAGWKDGPLRSYLIDISIDVLRKRDEDGQFLLPKILDSAQQKGTGSWTMMESITRGVYAPTIAEAVYARFFSQEKATRSLGRKIGELSPVRKVFSVENIGGKLENALYCAMVCCYAQGMEIIRKASADFGWNINLENAANLWRGGCIIRSDLLEPIAKAFHRPQDCPNLVLSKEFAPALAQKEADWREIVGRCIIHGLAVPALSSTLTYYDSCHTDPMPVGLIQGLRDCFGAHTYRRTDREGDFHTNWQE